MKLSFHGAAQTITGSCFLLESGGTRILIDCGLYQGGKNEMAANQAPFGFDPASIDYLLVTHAHLDHCGRIPLLVKQGFRGEILTTSASRDLIKLVLLDAAHLQEEESRRSKRYYLRTGRSPKEPLYTIEEALWSFDYFTKVARYNQTLTLSEHITVRFIEASHILGSASIIIEINQTDTPRSILFSGDLGNAERPLLKPYTAAGEMDYVVMECTYGDREHKDMTHSTEELYTAIESTLERGGNVIIPTFALERAQEILYFLRLATESGRLPKYLPVFLDSPMAISATEIFRRHLDCLKKELGQKDPFELPNLHFTRETQASMALNQIQGGAVILAGSGMCTGGRVVHHLKHNLWREKCSVILVGYAAPYTLARKLIDGAKTVSIFGNDVQVKAEIHTIGGFSAHAGQSELLEWHRQTGHPQKTFLVHGEADRGMKHFAAKLTARQQSVVLPRLNESYQLD